MRKWSTDFANPEVGNISPNFWLVGGYATGNGAFHEVPVFFFSHLGEVILQKDVFFAL